MKKYVFILRFKRRINYRHFALLDPDGVCITLMSCGTKPENGYWVEVKEMNLTWLGRPLPSRSLIV
jgi:hypothetical protein